MAFNVTSGTLGPGRPRTRAPGVAGKIDPSTLKANLAGFENFWGVSGVDAASRSDRHYVTSSGSFASIVSGQSPIRAFSVSLWVKANTTPNSFRGICHATTLWSSLSDGWSLYWLNSTTAKLFVGNFSGPANDAQVTGLSPVGNWIHFVATYNADAASGPTVLLYADAVSGTDAGTRTDDLTGTTNEFELMRTASLSTPNDDYADAVFDEVSVWNVALSQSDVTRIYNSGVPTNLAEDPSVSDLLLWWRCGDLPGDTGGDVTDASGNANGGSLEGSTGTATYVQDAAP